MFTQAACPLCGRPVNWREIGWSHEFSCPGCAADLTFKQPRGARNLLRVAIPFLRDFTLIFCAVLAGLDFGYLVGLLLWLAGLGFSIWWSRFSRPYFCTLRPRRPLPVCANCGYDLRGSPGPDCPECGGRFMSWAPRRTPEAQQNSARV